MTGVFPLTDLQEAYLVGMSDEVELGGFRPHYYIEFDVAGFDPGRAAEVLDRLVRRHEHLRTIVVDGGQRVLGLDETGPGTRVPVLDVRGRPAAEQESAIGDVRQGMCEPGPDPHEWPLLRMAATRVREHRYRVHVVMSLLLLDGASIRQVWSEFTALYADSAATLPPVTATFRQRRLDHLAGQDGPRYAEQYAYWLGRVDTLPDAPRLPLARPLSAVRPGGLVRRAFDLSAGQWAKLRATAQANRMMPATALLHAYAETLATWADEPRFSVNVLHPGAGGDPGQTVVGQLSSTLPLEVDLTAGGYWERGRSVQRQLWTDMARSSVSGVRVLREVAVRRGLPPRAALPYVFNSMLGNGMPAAAPGRTACRIVCSALRTPQVLIDNQVQDLPGGGVTCVWDTVDDAFPAGLAERMFAAYRATVEALAAGREPESAVPAAHRDLVARLNPPVAPDRGERLEAGFLLWAAATPAAPAVLTSDRTLTYAQLEAASRSVAHRLIAAGTRPGDLVPVVMAKGWEQVVAVLAILRAGAAYCPVDAALPAERVRRLLHDCAATVAAVQPTSPELASVTTVDVTPADLTTPTEPLPRGTDDRQLAYVIHTSGSTGTPKGVMIDHRGARNTIADVNDRTRLTSADRVFGVSSLSFDLSVWDVFGTLAAGAALVLPDAAPRPDPEAWTALAARHGVTVWNSVPALAELLCETTAADPAARRAPIRQFLLSGDWIPLPLPGRLRAWWPGCTILALGGATEASIWSNCFPVGRVDPSWRSVPYGRPLRGQTMTVLDDHRGVRAPWAVGRIHIGGAGLALGYLGDPDLTARRFVTGPGGERLYDTGDLGRYWPDGTIEFLGRADRQLKIQGFRVEPGEVEAALLADPTVRECAVGAQPSPGGLRLVAAVVPAVGATVDPAATIRRLRETLPTYLVPVRVAVVDRVPLTANGKVDVGALFAHPSTVVASPSPAVASSSPGVASSSPGVVVPSPVAVVPSPVAVVAAEEPGAAASWGASVAAAAVEARPALPSVEASVAAAIEVRVAELAGLWAELLEVPAVGPDDHFFALGGTSLLALRLVHRIRDRHGLKIRLGQVFETPTVRTLAAHIEALRATVAVDAGAGAPGVVATGSVATGSVAAAAAAPIAFTREAATPLAGAREAATSMAGTLEAGAPMAGVTEAGAHAAGARVADAAGEPDAGAVVLADRPGDRLWLFPPVGGSVGAYAELAAAWPGPVTAFSSPELLADGLAERTLAETAGIYRRAVQHVDPAGPYLLGGWSMGGVLAYEVAQQLAAAGRSSRILMIDSDASGVRGEPADAFAHIEFLTDLNEGHLPAPVRRRLTKSISDEEAYLLAAATGVFPGDLGLAGYRRLLEIHRRNLAALAAYRPAPAAPGVEATLAVATRPARRGAVDQWRTLCPGLTVDRHRADHYTIVRADRIREIARNWRTRLALDTSIADNRTSLSDQPMKRRYRALWTHSKGALHRAETEA